MDAFVLLGNHDAKEGKRECAFFFTFVQLNAEVRPTQTAVKIADTKKLKCEVVKKNKQVPKTSQDNVRN